ncbi:MAG: glycosyltransferase family 10 [Opitutae bacterium]
MRPLLIAFSDFIFWENKRDRMASFNPNNNFLTRVLAQTYDVRVVPMTQAEVIIYSSFGNNHRSFKGKKIFYTSENVLPDFDECDYAITFCHLPDEPRHLRLPQYIHYIQNPTQLIKGPDYVPMNILKEKDKFCNFVVSNPRGSERNKFFKMLNRRKAVDSGGRHFNNLGKVVSDKLSFIKDYKFTLSFENSSSPGYTTEKLVEPMLVNSLPIYWGNPDIARDFNPRSFINVSDFPSFNEAIDYILKVDSDDQLYLSYLKEPWFNGNRIPGWFTDEYIAKALKIFIDAPWTTQSRSYKNRGLRDHTLGSGLNRHLSSISCKLDSLLWKAGWRK